MNKQHIKNININNENGYTLLIVIMVLVVISILGLGLMGTSATTLKHSTSERDYQSAFYVAEAGLVQRKEEIVNMLNVEDTENQALIDTKNEYVRLLNLNNTEINSFNFEEYLYNRFYYLIYSKLSSLETSKTYSNINGDYEVQLENKPTKSIVTIKTNPANRRVITIVSTGSIGADDDSSRKVRTVTQDLIFTFTPTRATISTVLFDSKYALYIKNSTDIKNSKFQVLDINGRPENIALDPIIKFPDIPIVEKVNNSESLNSPIMLNGDLFLNKLDINGTSSSSNLCNVEQGNSFYSICTGNSNKKIYVNDLTISGDINIKGSGSLTIYVSNSFNISNANVSMSNNNDSTKLTIIYTGNELLHIKNGFNFYGLLAVPNATVKFTGNGKDDFRVTGTIFANSLFASGGSVQYAPTSQIDVIDNNNNDIITSLGAKIKELDEKEK